MKGHPFEIFKKIGRCIAFVASGIVAIIVGSFMLRGTMHLWDDSSKANEENDDHD